MKKNNQDQIWKIKKKGKNFRLNDAIKKNL
jgi:hypothetical protein